MGKKFAAYDEHGSITAQYDSIDSPVPDGLTNVTELTPEQYEDWLSAPAKWYAPNGVFTAVPPPTGALKLATAIASAQAVIDQFHASTVQELVGNPTQVEKDTWALKLEVANAITNKTAISAPGQAFLAGASLTTPEEQSTWAAAVLAKSAAYAQVVGLAERLRDAARTAVNASTDEESVQAVLDEQRAAAEAAVASLAEQASAVPGKTTQAN